MKHFKTNEEYRYFKGRKKSKLSDWDNQAPINKRDWDEPFFNKNKRAYLTKKRDEEVLSELGFPTDNWDWFLRTLSKRFHPSGSELQLWSERGTKGVDPSSYYYRVYLNHSDNDKDDIMYFFPKEKKIVIIYYVQKLVDGNGIGGGKKYKYEKTKKIFQYDTNNVVKVFNDVIEYLFSLKEDPEASKTKRMEEFNHMKQRKYKELLYTDDELEEPEDEEYLAQQQKYNDLPSHRKVQMDAEDTSTFDNYSFNHVQSFKSFEKIKINKEKIDKVKKGLKKRYNKMAQNPTNRMDLPKFKMNESFQKNNWYLISAVLRLLDIDYKIKGQDYYFTLKDGTKGMIYYIPDGAYGIDVENGESFKTMDLKRSLRELMGGEENWQ